MTEEASALDVPDHRLRGYEHLVGSHSGDVSSICQVLSGDPADLFTCLYDLMPEEPFRGYQAEDWAARREHQQLADHVCELVYRRGRMDLNLIEAAIPPGAERQLLAVLVGLDRALQYADPSLSGHELGRLRPVALRYAEFGRLSTERVPGALLPRYSTAGRPPGRPTKAEWFTAVRVPASSWNAVEHDRIPRRYDISLPHGSTIAVGCVPLLGSLEDIRLRVVERNGRPGYRLWPTDEPVLRERIAGVLRELDNGGAVIGVMPEGSLSGSLLRYWQSEIRATARDARQANSPLRWLLVGSGPVVDHDDPPPNRAVLLDRRTGDEIFHQDKVNGFTLTPAQIRAWGLQEHLGRQRLHEDITRGTRIGVWESNLGRITVLICEDLTRPTTAGRDVQACLVSHVLVPIFSKPIRRHRWEQNAAEPLIWQVGAWVVIVNSLVIARAQGRRGTVNTCMVIGPPSNGDEWTPDQEVHRSGRPESVTVLQIPIPHRERR